jgi:hypothetical protein
VKSNEFKYFTRESMECDFSDDEVDEKYKLVFSFDERSPLKCEYLFDFSKYSDEQKIEIIEELLRYEGDTSLCSVRTKCYNPLRSQTVPEKAQVYSIQVEALFIINHVILSNPYMYSSFPILRNGDGTAIESIGGPLIKKAFLFYHGWLEQARRNGLTETSSKTLPLKNNGQVFWL